MSDGALWETEHAHRTAELLVPDGMRQESGIVVAFARIGQASPKQQDIWEPWNLRLPTNIR